MTEIIALPDGAYQHVHYQNVLNGCGKSFYIAADVSDLREQVRLSMAKPQLILCDFTALVPLEDTVFMELGASYLRKIPLIVVASVPVNKKDYELKIAGTITFPELTDKPQNLQKMVADVIGVRQAVQKIRKAAELAKRLPSQPSGDFREQTSREAQAFFHAHK